MFLKIGEWLVDARLDEIRRGEVRLKLDGRSMALLQYLAAKPGEVVSTEELLANVWQGVIVAPSSVYQTIAVLRRWLGDDADKPRYIATVQRKGYRLIAAVEAVEPSAAGPSRAISAAQPLRRSTWRMLAAASVAGLLLSAYWIASESLRGRHSQTARRDLSIAVLPFESADGDPEKAYVADGLTEGVLLTLGRLPGLRVTARSSAFVFRERHEDVRTIAAALGVRYLLDGRVRQVEDQIRIGVQLVDGITGFALWSETYDRPLADTMRVQLEIARSVARVLELVLSRDVSLRLARGTSLDALAIDAYLRGRADWSERSAVSLRSAREHYARAIQRDPRFAAAHVGLAELLVLLPLYGIEPPAVAFPQARVAALRALELDPDLADARATLAVVLYQFEWNWPAAETEFRRALELNPNYSTARQWYAEFLSYLGRTRDAEAQIAVAGELDPLSPTIATLRGSPAFWARRPADAERHFRAAIERHPDFALAHYSLAMSQLAIGRADEARQSFEVARKGLQDEFVAPSLAHALVAEGRRSDAEALLAALYAGERGRYVSSYKIAVLLAALEQTDAAFARLEQAKRAHDDRLVLIAVDPFLDSLRADDRFVALRRAVMGPDGKESEHTIAADSQRERH
ncbi:MAG: tetratricopeptide repeat protein [Steroidobacteraceae bacterium]